MLIGESGGGGTGPLRRSEPLRTQAERSVRTRRLLLDSTIECLSEQGFTNCSITEVVKRAGVTRGALFHHFPTKAALLAAAVWTQDKTNLTRAIGRLKQAVEAGASLEAQLRITWEEDVENGLVYHQFNLAARNDPDLAKAYQDARIAAPSLDSNTSPVAWATAPGDPSPLLSRFVVGCFTTGLTLSAPLNTEDFLEQTFLKFAEIMRLALAAMAAAPFAETLQLHSRSWAFEDKGLGDEIEAHRAPGRTQAERSALMQRRLLDVTFQCLADMGYANCSTTEILKRADVSRGALFHHFPTKAVLVAQAMWARRKTNLARNRARLAQAVEAGAPLETQLRIAWEESAKDAFVFEEFNLAVRNDPALAEAFREAMLAAPSPDTNIGPVAWATAPGDPSPLLTRFVVGCFTTGLALAGVVAPPQTLESTFCKFADILRLALSAMDDTTPTGNT